MRRLLNPAAMAGGTVSRAVASNHPDYRPDEWVLSYKWLAYRDISDGEGLASWVIQSANILPGRWVFRMPVIWGYWISATERGGETLVVAAANGPRRRNGWANWQAEGLVVGIAGGAEKKMPSCDRRFGI